MASRAGLASNSTVEGSLHSEDPNRHGNSDETWFAWLSRFRRELREGDRGMISNPVRHVPDIQGEAVGLWREHGLETLISESQMKRAAELAEIQHLLNSAQLAQIRDLTTGEREALQQQRSLRFWNDTKSMILTFLCGVTASYTQGFDQSANGNLGWPKAFGVDPDLSKPNSSEVWIFAGVNAIPWFTASLCFLVDMLQYQVFGRRHATFIAGAFSFGGVMWASQARSWQELMVARALLGIGLGSKAQAVPVWESESFFASKRGAYLCSWQISVSLGLFSGSVASYILRDDFRKQIMSGALPALLLLALSFVASESPRWLMVRGRYKEALEVFIRLSGNQVIAAKELIFIHYQLTAERWIFFRPNEHDLQATPQLLQDVKRLGFFQRYGKLFTIKRYQRAMIASAIAMLCQPLSGINTLGFLYSTFFLNAISTANPDINDQDAEAYSLKLGIAFGCLNFVFSLIAVFFVDSNEEMRIRRPILGRFRGRRFLLLFSMAGCLLSLTATSLIYQYVPENNPHKKTAFIAMIMIFVIFYSPGAGAIPFLYSNEIWGAELKEIGSSWGVLVNFTGAGLIALFAPLGMGWGTGKILGLFAGFNFLGFVLVYFFLPSVDDAPSIEDMNQVFSYSLRKHAADKYKRLLPNRGAFRRMMHEEYTDQDTTSEEYKNA